MYAKNKSVNEPNFLASAKFQNFTYQISDSGVSANSDGKKIVPAGTVYKVNNTAVGLLFNDVDVTEGPQAGAVMVEGYVIEARLPATVESADKTAMKEIKFR